MTIQERTDLLIEIENNIEDFHIRLPAQLDLLMANESKIASNMKDENELFIGFLVDSIALFIPGVSILNKLSETSVVKKITKNMLFKVSDLETARESLSAFIISKSTEQVKKQLVDGKIDTNDYLINIANFGVTITEMIIEYTRPIRDGIDRLSSVNNPSQINELISGIKTGQYFSDEMLIVLGMKFSKEETSEVKLNAIVNNVFKRFKRYVNILNERDIYLFSDFEYNNQSNLFADLNLSIIKISYGHIGASKMNPGRGQYCIDFMYRIPAPFLKIAYMKALNSKNIIYTRDKINNFVTSKTTKHCSVILRRMFPVFDESKLYCSKLVCGEENEIEFNSMQYEFSEISFSAWSDELNFSDK